MQAGSRRISWLWAVRRTDRQIVIIKLRNGRAQLGPRDRDIGLQFNWMAMVRGRVAGRLAGIHDDIGDLIAAIRVCTD